VRTLDRLAPAALGAVFALLASGPAMAQMGPVTAEYRSKANFLATFPSFIDRPDDAFPKAGPPFAMRGGRFPVRNLSGLSDQKRIAARQTRRGALGA
jgi:hypothetical protein